MSVSADLSQTRLLQLSAYWKDTPLVSVTTGDEDCPDNGSKKTPPTGLIRVCQWSVDIEQWLYVQVPEFITTDNSSSCSKSSLHSITDYDIELLEVHNVIHE